MKKIAKRCIAFLLVLIMTAGMLAFSATAADVVASGKCGDNATFTLTDDGTLTISGEGMIKAFCFLNPPLSHYSDRIVKVVIKSGITAIGSYAFGDCRNMSSVTIPEGVTDIERGAFSGCDSLASVTIPNGVTSIGDAAFYICASLKSVSIPGSVAKIGSRVFYGCNSLTRISVDGSNPYFSSDEKGVLYNKDKTSILTVPAKLSGSYVIPDSVTNIGDNTFSDCAGLTSVTIPGSVKSIGNWAFKDCTGLASVTLPEGVETIWNRAFYGCTGLKSITIPNSVTIIGSNAFERCTSLKTIRLSDNLTGIRSGLFTGCTGLTDITIPDSVIRIESGAFSRCTSLSGITIPENVHTIESGVFSGCTALTRISIDENNPYFTGNADGTVLNKDKTSLLIVPSGLSGYYTVPSDVVEIGEGAFYGCENLTGIIIPGSVRGIAAGAFNMISARLIFTGNPPSAGGKLIVNDSFTYSAVFAEYPHSNPAWTETVQQSLGDNIIWIPDNYDTSVKDTPRDKTEALTPASSDNKGDNEYINTRYWADKVNSYLVDNDDGTFTRVEHIGNSVVVEDYDSSFKIKWKKTIDKELPLYGGFYSGTDYNFFVFGQSNHDEDDSKPVVRIVRYTKNWHRLDSTELCGANTYNPFEAGSLRMTEKDGVLYIHTCHKIYKMDDGLRHQTNMFIAVSIPYMKIVAANYHVGGVGYVSHSFNQFIIADGDSIVWLDHGDAYPRAVTITRFTGLGSNEENADVLPICGEEGNNRTGVSVGGFEASGTCYLVAGNTVVQDEKSYKPSGTRNVFITATDKSRMSDADSTVFRWITNYTDSDKITVSNPLLTKIESDRFLLMWTETDGNRNSVMRHVFLDGEGNPTSAISQSNYPMSDCQPIVAGNRVIWYVTENSAPRFFSINLDGTTSYPKGDVNRDGTVSNSDLILAARHVVSLTTLTGEQFTLGDMNNDGVITNTDIITIARKIVGLN